MHKAARQGDLDTVAALLSKGASPNAKDRQGRTPLHWAADAGFWDEVNRRFNAAKKGGAVRDSSAHPSDGCYVCVLELLLENGGDPDTPDKKGRTPLHGAALCNFLEGAKLLLAKGADVSAKAADGSDALGKAETTASAMASQESRQRAQAALYDPWSTPAEDGDRFDNSEMVKLLMEYGTKSTSGVSR